MKDQFVNIFRENIIRPGADVLLDWLCNRSDFFNAPASTRFHGAYKGGLAEHSLNVYNRLKTLAGDKYNGETIAIVALLHDLCKANYYTVEMRNKKNERGEWEQVPFYTVNDKFPYGHGEKSVYIASEFMRLTAEEAMAIRWHMGGFDSAVKGGDYSLSAAWEKFPLGMLLHCADLQATYIDESRGN
jgi:hypothetical protein